MADCRCLPAVILKLLTTASNDAENRPIPTIQHPKAKPGTCACHIVPHMLGLYAWELRCSWFGGCSSICKLVLMTLLT